MSTHRAETAASYAALILADAEVAITAEKLNTLIRAAGIEDIEPIWATLFAKALEGKDVKELVLNVDSAPVGEGTGKDGGGDGTGKEGDGGHNGEADGGETDVDKKGDDSDSDGDIGMGLFDF